MRSFFIWPLLLGVGLILPWAPADAQVRVSVTVAPPMLPVYDQPICPGDGYLWTPGYWAWDNDYYWVPGEWIMPPEAGYLWTPGYWGWGGDGFMFNEGYWGLSVGFYGGINYGFGYFGRGYDGGRWDHGHFFYNSSLNNINRGSIHNVYDKRVNEGTTNHVSYNGGHGGINLHANSKEEAASRERHIAPVSAQTEHAQTARNNPQQRVSANHGAPANSGGNRSNAAVHPKELPAIEHPAKPDTGNPKLDQKYQKQQDKLVAKQNQDRQKLQTQQDREHVQMARQQGNEARSQQQKQQHQEQQQRQQQTQQDRQQQQMARQQSNEMRSQQQEQQHQQQTQQMQQRHVQQSQQMAQRQSMGGGESHGGGARGGGGGGRR